MTKDRLAALVAVSCSPHPRHLRSFSSAEKSTTRPQRPDPAAELAPHLFRQSQRRVLCTSPTAPKNIHDHFHDLSSYITVCSDLTLAPQLLLFIYPFVPLIINSTHSLNDSILQLQLVLPPIFIQFRYYYFYYFIFIPFSSHFYLIIFVFCNVFWNAVIDMFWLCYFDCCFNLIILVYF